ncbi:MAG: hypothetical protein LBS88_13285 [Tannerellaceae bacterium]|nr:hypothetical protein [Tannerellaceae bacterium]
MKDGVFILHLSTGLFPVERAPFLPCLVGGAGGEGRPNYTSGTSGYKPGQPFQTKTLS